MAVVPSPAVARSTAVPTESAWNTPLLSTLAIAGVSDVHVKLAPDTPVSVAKTCASKPTGSAGSVTGSRPLKLSAGGGGATGPPHALT